MTNNEIIFETVRASFTPAQLAELVAATYTAEQIAARRAGVKITVAEGSDETPDAVFHAMLAADTFHTFAEWKRMGYSVKKGQHAALVCNLWKYTDKPGKAAKEAAAAAGRTPPRPTPISIWQSPTCSTPCRLKNPSADPAAGHLSGPHRTKRPDPSPTPGHTRKK